MATLTSAASMIIVPPPRECAFELFVVASLVDQAPKYRHVVPIPAHLVNRRFPFLVRFCFATVGDPADSLTTQFVFVLTNDTGMRMYGFCTRTVWGDVYCFLSKYFWPQFFKDLTLMFMSNGEDVAWLKALQLAPVPSPGRAFILSSIAAVAPGAPSSTNLLNGRNRSTSTYRLPTPSSTIFNDARGGSAVEMKVISTSPAHPLVRRPRIAAETHQSSYLLDHLLPVDIVRSVAAMLNERRVVVMGLTTEIVSIAVMAMEALLRPFVWPHVLVPVVPKTLIDVVGAPTPFVVGLTYGQVAQWDRRDQSFDGVVIVRLGVMHGGGVLRYPNAQTHPADATTAGAAPQRSMGKRCPVGAVSVMTVKQIPALIAFSQAVVDGCIVGKRSMLVNEIPDIFGCPVAAAAHQKKQSEKTSSAPVAEDGAVGAKPSESADLGDFDDADDEADQEDVDALDSARAFHDVPYTGPLTSFQLLLKTAKVRRVRRDYAAADRLMSSAFCILWANIFGRAMVPLSLIQKVESSGSGGDGGSRSASQDPGTGTNSASHNGSSNHKHQHSSKPGEKKNVSLSAAGTTSAGISRNSSFASVAETVHDMSNLTMSASRNITVAAPPAIRTANTTPGGGPSTTVMANARREKDQMRDYEKVTAEICALLLEPLSKKPDHQLFVRGVVSTILFDTARAEQREKLLNDEEEAHLERSGRLPMGVPSMIHRHYDGADFRKTVAAAFPQYFPALVWLLEHQHELLAPWDVNREDGAPGGSGNKGFSSLFSSDDTTLDLDAESMRRDMEGGLISGSARAACWTWFKESMIPRCCWN